MLVLKENERDILFMTIYYSSGLVIWFIFTRLDLFFDRMGEDGMETRLHLKFKCFNFFPRMLSHLSVQNIAHISFVNF